MLPLSVSANAAAAMSAFVMATEVMAISTVLSVDEKPRSTVGSTVMVSLSVSPS